MKTHHAQLIALAGVALAIAACQTTTPSRFDQADANRDKALSLDETNGYLVSETFSARDANKDRQMTRAEWMANNEPREEKSFRERDANNDGTVTMDEALAFGRKKGLAKKFVAGADSNKDGQLSSEEVTAYYASREGPAR